MDKRSPTRRLPVTLTSLRRASGRTLVLKLKFAEGVDFAYRPGQFIGLEAQDGRPRFFSIANADSTGGELELHVSRVPGGAFTGALFDRAQVGDRFWIEGPYGNFFISPEASTRTIIVAGGTGFAPIKACLEGIARMRNGRDAARTLHFYWGARSLEDLYDLDAVRALVERLPGMRFTPVVDHGDGATRSGYVHRAVIEDFEDLSDYDIYACGAPGMIEALSRQCADERAFDPQRLIADPFVAGPVGADLMAPSTGAPVHLFLDREVNPRAIAGVDGEALVTALNRSGVALRAVCGGKGACGTCLVRVAPSWRTRAGDPARRETRLLQFVGAGDGDRLSCQIRLSADLNGLELHTLPQHQRRPE